MLADFIPRHRLELSDPSEGARIGLIVLPR